MDPEAYATLLANVFSHLVPEIILGAAACVLFLGGTLRSSRNLWALVSLLALVLAGLTLPLTLPGPAAADSPIARYATPVVFDSLSTLVRVVALAVGIILVLFSWNEVPERQAADHHACLVLIIAGLGLVGAANDLVMLFLALELISIPTYLLLYLPRFDNASQEATLKYFLLSIFSSALLLFGFSYLYGIVGSTNLSVILNTLNQRGAAESIPAVAEIALVMIVAGLGFKIAAAPFHFYAPDVYQGAPTVGAALLAAVPKLAGFVALVRVLGFVLPQGVTPRSGLVGMGLSEQVPILFWFLAAITMFLGNLLALLQDNLKRLLAYSSIAHAGYMLIALAVAPYLAGAGQGGADGVSALLYYLVAYAAMTIGAFQVISYLSTPSRPLENVEDLAGLGRSQPGLALFMTVFLFSLIGIPLTAGFTGKLLIFFGALAVPATALAAFFRVLALLGVLNAAIGGWYYLRVVAVMYLRDPLRPVENARSVPGLASLWICALLTVALSIPPGADWLLSAVRSAARDASPAASATAARE